MGSGTAELWLAVLVLIWGVNFSVIKSAFDWVSPMGFNALRFPVACVVLYLLLRRQGGAIALPSWALRRIATLALIGHFAYQAFFAVGLDLTLAGNASVLLATTPIWTTLLSAKAGHETIGGRLWLATIGTVTGVVMVTLGGASDLGLRGGGALWGELLMVLAAMVWAVYTVGGRPLVEKYGALPVTAWALWFGTIPIVVVGMPGVLALDVSTLPMGFWVRVLFAGALGIAVAYLIWYQGVRTLGSSRTSIFGNAIPVIALVVAWLWLGERPGWLQLLGALVILVALQLSRAPRPKTAT